MGKQQSNHIKGISDIVDIDIGAHIISYNGIVWIQNIDYLGHVLSSTVTVNK